MEEAFEKISIEPGMELKKSLRPFFDFNLFFEVLKNSKFAKLNCVIIWKLIMVHTLSQGTDEPFADDLS